MSDNDYWENAYESGEYKHWEFSYPSPELVALAAANVPRRNARVLDVGSAAEPTLSSWLNADLKSQASISVPPLLKSQKKEQKKPMLKWIGSEGTFWSSP